MFALVISFYQRLFFFIFFLKCVRFHYVLRQEDRQLAAGLLSCAGQLYLPVLPAPRMAGAKDDGQKAASQPQTCTDSLQLCHGRPVRIYVL